MFKEIYKAANDDIKADEELLNKVLKNKRRKRMPVYRYSAIAASVAVIAIGGCAVDGGQEQRGRSFCACRGN